MDIRNSFHGPCDKSFQVFCFAEARERRPSGGATNTSGIITYYMEILRKQRGEQCHEYPAMNINVSMHAKGTIHTDHLYDLQAMTKGGDILQACYRRGHERKMRVSRYQPATGCRMAVLFQCEIPIQKTFEGNRLCYHTGAKLTVPHDSLGQKKKSTSYP